MCLIAYEFNFIFVRKKKIVLLLLSKSHSKPNNNPAYLLHTVLASQLAGRKRKIGGLSKRETESNSYSNKVLIHWI